MTQPAIIASTNAIRNERVLIHTLDQNAPVPMSLTISITITLGATIRPGRTQCMRHTNSRAATIATMDQSRIAEARVMSAGKGRLNTQLHAPPSGGRAAARSPLIAPQWGERAQRDRGAFHRAGKGPALRERSRVAGSTI